MEFICLQEDIRKILSLSESIVSTKTTIPILSNVLIEAKDKLVKISATDLEVGFSSVIDAEVITEGSITVLARKALDIIKSFSGGTLRLMLDMNKLRIKSEDNSIKAKFAIQGMPKENFPEMPLFVEHNVFALKTKLLKDVIRKTISAVSTDETRYYLNGILFDIQKEHFFFVATDGKRLSLIKIKNDLDESIKETNKHRVIVPAKILSELVSVFDSGLDTDTDDNTDCLISITEKQIFFKVANTELFSNLFEGQFPNYNDVVPEVKHEEFVTIDKLSLYEAIRRVSLIVDPKISMIKLDFGKDKLVVSGRNTELGDAKDEIAIDYKREDIEIAFNYNYIMDAIKEIEQKEIELHLKEHTNPILIQGKDKEHYFSVIMPMKLP